MSPCSCAPGPASARAESTFAHEAERAETGGKHGLFASSARHPWLFGRSSCFLRPGGIKNLMNHKWREARGQVERSCGHWSLWNTSKPTVKPDGLQPKSNGPPTSLGFTSGGTYACFDGLVPVAPQGSQTWTGRACEVWSCQLLTNRWCSRLLWRGH